MEEKNKKSELEVLEKVSENISLYSDGKYRWVYELNMFKNPIIFFTVWKIFFYIMLFGFVLGILVSLKQTNFFWEGFLKYLSGWAIGFGVMTVIVYLAHTIYALIMGGKYCVIFEMDEDGIRHTQMEKQMDKVQVLAKLVFLAGALSGKASTMGLGINTGVKTSSYSEFKNVKRVKVTPLTKVIKVREGLEHNQVYASKEDLGFVKEYIESRCVNTKKYKKEHANE